MAVENYYEVLGVGSSADGDALRIAIRTTRRRYRAMTGSPDKEQARQAEVMMETLARAEQTLLDPQARRQHDAQLAAQRAPAAEPPPVEHRATSRWLEAARSYLVDGQPRNALQAAREATRADPDSADAWVVRASAALQLTDYEDADFAANEANRLRPRDPQTVGLIADVYDAEGRHVDAQRAFARAADLDPTNPYWMGRVAWAMSDRGDFEGAVACARHLVSRFPEAQHARDVLAHQLLREADGGLSRTPSDDLHYFTSKNQVAHVEQRIAEVEALRPLHESAETALARARDHLAFGRRRRFIRPSGGTVIRVVLYALIGAWLLLSLLTAVMGDTLGALVWLGLNVALGWRLVIKTFPVQWAVNKKALGPLAMTGVQ